ncbi:hypothetical protein E8P82_10840 [Arthrobacter echini]|uniref:DUF2530 domain-containing protein n=1 Tax=Arthrobacter echini TaxID=1529066 RepID=A0A4S5E2Z5_9MICC|nr:hypothetical protein [Arthrobacter echini]THJ65778.1 hypothetical protein E8P82_10840 [Arthrobacter echini]
MSDESSARRVHATTNRGSFRLLFMTWSVLTALQLFAVMINVLGGQDWAFAEYLNVFMVVLGFAVLGYLVQLRRRDEHLWREDEERRADWDRRGRAL